MVSNRGFTGYQVTAGPHATKGAKETVVRFLSQYADKLGAFRQAKFLAYTTQSAG